jgi:hypothetical protein
LTNYVLSFPNTNCHYLSPGQKTGLLQPEQHNPEDST